MDLVKYNSQIKELISLRHESDFATLLDKILFGESNSDKFLIKMELNRLTTPCKRVIDLRDKVISECYPYDLDNIKHYLTVEALDIFKKNLEFYGEYTIGVFEAVHQYISQKKQIAFNENDKAENNDTKNRIEFLTLINNRKRATPRMYFVSNVYITLSGGKSLQAQTADISTTGLKIKLPYHISLRNEELLEILFTDLRHSFHEPILNKAIKYRLVKQKQRDSKYYLYLTLIDSNKIFSSFLRYFIRTNHYKYKFDVHYYYQLAKIDALKISYLKQLNSLPIFLSSQQYSPILFTLKNNQNDNILKDWVCNEVNQLEFLFNELRFNQLCIYTETHPATTLYCFTHQAQGKDFFISATEEELNHFGLKNLFLNYGCRKDSWRVYHLTIQSYQYIERVHYEFADFLPQQFVNITHVATLQPISYSTNSSVQQIDTKDINKINHFVHRLNKSNGFDIFDIFNSERRKEARYILNSKLLIAVGDKEYSGNLVDFSLTGLRIKLDKISDLRVQSHITVNLFELQKIVKTNSLTKLNYKVVHVSPGNIYHLQIKDKQSLTISDNFFSLLIKNNKEKFKCLPLKAKAQPSQKRLLELSDSILNNAILFINNEKSLPRIKYAAINHVRNPIKILLNRKKGDEYLLQQLLLDDDYLYERLITLPLNEQKTGNNMLDTMIYIKEFEEDGTWKTQCMLETDFNSAQEKFQFIQLANNSYHFYAIFYRLRKVADPSIDMNSNSPELKLITQSSKHLIKNLQEELMAIGTIVELIDRTKQELENIKGE